MGQLVLKNLAAVLRFGIKSALFISPAGFAFIFICIHRLSLHSYLSKYIITEPAVFSIIFIRCICLNEKRRPDRLFSL